MKGYTDKTAIENYMLITIDPSFDEQIDEWIESVEETIDLETGKDFSVFDEEEGEASDRLYDGDDSNTLYVGPVTDVTAVKLSADGDAIDEDNYYLYPANSEVKNRIVMPYQTFPAGNQNIVVTGNFGLATMKKDIKLAATIMVSNIILNAYPDGSEVQSITMGRYSVTYKNPKVKDDLQSVEDILQRNKRYHF